MRCSACGSDVPATSKFCTSCGAAQGVVCPQCRHTSPPGSRFCAECGAVLAGEGANFNPGTPETYTPPALAQKILAGRASLEGERKQITVLFADVSGFTRIAAALDPEEVRDLLRRAFDIMLAEVHRYEGTVSQFLGDGMLCLFGAPIAHEDHAHRAIRAALGMQRALASYQQELQAQRAITFRVRIGLNSGPVVVGSVGVDLTMDYLAVGDTVNLASRVQNVADPGTVLITEHTHRLVEGAFEVSEKGPFTFKGKDEPIRVLEVHRPRRSRSRVDLYAERGLTPLVGRQPEIDLLLDRFTTACAGEGQIVLIRGEAGIGKSRLLHEMKRRLEGEDLTWLEGRCVTYGIDIPYLPVVDLLKNAFEVDESDDAPAIIAKLESRSAPLGGDVVSALPYLKYLLAVDPGDSAIAGMDPTLRKARTIEALHALIIATATLHPLALVVEDIHWIDQLSEQFLSSLAGSVAKHPVLLILTHRTGHEHRLGARPSYAQLHLEALSERESAKVAHGLLGAAAMPLPLQRLIYRKAEGNPFFVEEVTKSLLEAGAITREGNNYVLARPIDEIHVPDSVQDVIMARIDRLPDAAKKAMQTASVIGREFTVRLLARAAETPHHLEDDLHALKAVELIFEGTLYPELAYMFKHALTHEVTYNSLLLARRRVLHGLIGRAIEELYGDRLPEQYEVLAYHYLRAEEWEKTLDYCQKSAEKSSSRLAPGDAIRHYESALAATEHLANVPTERLLAIRKALAGLYFAVGNFPRSRAEAETELALARALGDGAAEGAALFDVAWAAQWAEDFVTARSFAEQAAEIAERASAPTALAGAEFISAYLRAIVGELDGLDDRFQRVVELSRSTNDRTRESLTLGTAGVLNQWRGDVAESIELTDTALRIAREHNLLVPLARGLWTRGIVLTTAGRYDEGLSALEEGLAITERIGDENNVPRYLNTIGWLYGECGDFQRAVAMAEATMERSRKRKHGIGVEMTAFSLVNLADQFLSRGDLASAAEALQETQRLADDPSHEWMKWRYRMHMQVSLGEYWLMRGEPDRAEPYLAQCLEAATRTVSRKYLVRAWRLEGEIATFRRDWPAASTALGRALEQARTIGNPPQLWKTWQALGQLQTALGERERAAESLDAAQRVIDDLAAGLTNERLRTTLKTAWANGELQRTAAAV